LGRRAGQLGEVQRKAQEAQPRLYMCDLWVKKVIALPEYYTPVDILP
jgi:hypothetical protein